MLLTLPAEKPRSPTTRQRRTRKVSIPESNIPQQAHDDVVHAEPCEPIGPLGIDRLRAPENSGGAALSAADISRLMDSGYATVESIAFTPMRRLLSSVKCIGEKRAERMKSAACKMIPMGFQSAGEFLQRRKEMIRLTTGSTALDGLLKGGIETGSITEIVGEFRTGKTQLCHTLCVTSQLPVDRGGAAGKVIYIDTEGTFRPERLVEIAGKYNMDAQVMLSNVVYARAYNSEHQQKLIVEAASVLANGARFALIIIDSATALFRTDFQGRGELADRQQSLGRFLRILQRTADEFGTAVVITNQVIANVDSMPFAGPPTKPAGGHVIAHASQTRLFLRKGMGDKRICKVYDSPSLPDSEAHFILCQHGVSDETPNDGKKRNRKDNSDSDDD